MTPAERHKPTLINPSRKRRIAAGCGMKVEDVNRLLKQYDQTMQIMKRFKNNGKGKKGKKGRRGLGGLGGMMGGLPGMPGGQNPFGF